MSCVENKKSNAETTSAEQTVLQTPEATTVEVTDSCCVKRIVGVYKGTLPAASSPGIKTELTLNEDLTFVHFSEFLEEKDGKFTEKGTFKVADGVLTATADEGTITYFKVEEGQLRMLNQDKEEIIGEMAELYVLKKTE